MAIEQSEVNQSGGGPSARDLAAITETARDYIESWLDGDGDRMRRCLHPDLVKRTVERDAGSGEWTLGPPADAALMVEWTLENVRVDDPAERAYEIIVVDVFRHIASVRVLSRPYMDYLQIAKIGDRWVIANVLWEQREGGTRL
jgi:hypothetical protein